MAELMGIIGSSAALFDLAGKISTCIIALRRLLSEIRDVSSKLSAMMQEVEILEVITEAVKLEFNNNENSKLANWNDTAIFLVVEYCQRALDDLNIVLRDLVQEIEDSRGLRRYKAKVLAVMRKGVLDRCHTRLQSAVRSLTLTQQWYIIALLKIQPTLIADRLVHRGFVGRTENYVDVPVGEVLETIPRRLQQRRGTRLNPTSPVNSEECGTPSYTNFWKFGPLGSVAWRYFLDSGGLNSRNFGFNARVQANYWFASRIWDIQASRAATGWTIKLNAYCVQPESAPVFCYARNGDIAGILRLFDLGKASLQDHTPSGQSLLHFASEFGHLELFKALAVGGLDLCEYDHGSARPVENMIVLGNRHRRVDIAALQQFYLENDVYREGGLLLHPNEWAYIYELLSFSSPEAVRTILPSAVPRFYERLNLEERIKYCSFDDPDGDPETLLFMMNARCNLSHEDISNLQQKSVCFLAIMAFRYGPMSARGGFYHASPWRKLVREAIPLTEDISFRGIGLDPTFQSREFQNKGLKSNPVLEFLQRIEPLTALFTVLSYFRYEKQEHQAPTCPRDLRKRAQIALRWWLEDLAGCQVSLMEYGRRERRIFLRNEKLKKAWYYGGRGFEHKNNSDACVLERMARLVDFDYGANPGDWRLHWDTEVERYAGEFWSSVEGIVPQL